MTQADRKLAQHIATLARAADAARRAGDDQLADNLTEMRNSFERVKQMSDASAHQMGD